MLRQKKHRRALWAAAFAAAPIGAHAGPVAPSATCTTQGELSAIQWGQGPTLTGNGSVISATESGGYSITQSKGAGGAQVQNVPFVCGFDLTKVKSDGGAVTRGANVFATATLTAGSAFAIDFGAFNGRGILHTKELVDYTPVLTAASYLLSGYGTAGTKGAPYGQTVVTDFNLYLEGANPYTELQLVRDYLGVQVISHASVLSRSDRFFIGSFEGSTTPQLVFDPSFSGTATVNLLTSPEPALTGASSAVPEPGTLALLGAGFIGLLAALRRRKRPEDRESEA